MEHNIVVCDCTSPEHQIIFSIVKGEQWPIYVRYHLYDAPRVWERVWLGIKYIFGHRSRYCNWGEMVLGEEGALDLRDYLNSRLEDNDG